MEITVAEGMDELRIHILEKMASDPGDDLWGLLKEAIDAAGVDPSEGEPSDEIVDNGDLPDGAEEVPAE